MENQNFCIIIISDQKPRTEVLSKIVENNFSEIQNIPIVSTDNLDSVHNFQQPLVLLIDLMGTNKSSKEIILPLRKKDSGLKMIALHMYQSPKLINPLYSMGINGYVFYEPSREELVDAIRKVTNGETYKPDYLWSA